MTQLNIVTTPVNSGDGTPLATAFNYCNSNFSELYARAQSIPPATLIGSVGDSAGMYAYDPTYFYYCFANYDGSNTIWAQVSQTANIAVSAINNGSSNVAITGLNGDATISINGISNIAAFRTTGAFVTGIVSATGNIRGNFILGNGSQLTGLPATYGNSNVTALLSAFGSNAISTTGTVNGGNLFTTGQSSSVGNVTGGNLNTSGQVNATGNIVTSQYFVGNFLGNVTGNFTVPGSNTQVIYNTAGNADASAGFTFDTAGPNLLTVLGAISSQGNVQAGNFRSTGLVSVTGNIVGGNLSGTNIAGTLTTATQNNITSVGTLSSLSVTANIAGGNITTGGQISATGNIRTSNYLFVTQDINTSGTVTATNYTGTSSSLSGNVTGGNIRTVGQVSATGDILTGGIVSATGNVTGNYILGNGSQLTGLSIATNTIQNGNSNVLVGSSAGNVSINVNGIAPLAIFTPLGQTTTGIISATGTVTAGNIVTGGNISSTGNVTGGNLTTGGQIDALGNIIGNNLSVSTGTIIVGNIVNANGNAIGNIGSASNYFNTVFAKATSAQYADLAEIYSADADYNAGTVVVFGGTAEITTTTTFANVAVAGVISTDPAYLMNSSMAGLPVALRGRVPVKVVGPVYKGDLLVTADANPGYAVSIGQGTNYPLAVFAKSIETNTDEGVKVITAVII